jgi:hypothetical protein
MPSLSFEELHRVFEKHERIMLVYLFGSLARGQETSLSDVDIAVLLEELPDDLLGFTLNLIDELSVILGDRVDLVFLNEAPPLLRHQVIKHGRVIYSRSEEERVRFEVKSEREYLDLSFLYRRYNQVLLEEA